MSLTIRAVVVRTPGAAAQVEEITLDDPGPHEVRVRILATGVCHSDLLAKHGKFGNAFPYVLGHEATAVVEALGPDVTNVREGQRVVLSWQSPCRQCRFCTTNRAALCPTPATAQPRAHTKDGQVLGRVLTLGTFATHAIVHELQAIPIDPELPARATCLIGCAVATGVGAAMIAARVSAGSRVAVFGCGTVGLNVIQGARLAHASQIIAVDIHASKLEQARTFGATDVVNARDEDPSKAIRKRTDGAGVDFAFEAIGLPDTLAQALGSCGVGGTCMLIGVPAPGTTLSYPMTKLFYLRQTLKTTFCGDTLPSRDFPLFARWYREGALALDQLVSRTIGMSDVDEAFAALERGETLRSVMIVADA